MCESDQKHAHAWTHTHVHTHIYACMHMYTHIGMHAHMYTLTQHTHACAHTHTHSNSLTQCHMHRVNLYPYNHTGELLITQGSNNGLYLKGARVPTSYSTNLLWTPYGPVTNPNQ